MPIKLIATKCLWIKVAHVTANSAKHNRLLHKFEFFHLNLFLFFLSVSSYLICFLHIILEAALIFPVENKTDNETLWAQEMQHQGDSFSVITCTMLSWFKKTSLPSAQWFSLCSPQPVAAQLLRHRDTKKSEETIFFLYFILNLHVEVLRCCAETALLWTRSLGA